MTVRRAIAANMSAKLVPATIMKIAMTHWVAGANGSIERPSMENPAALRPIISARERFYADTRSARRGNAPLRQTGSIAGPVLYLRFVRHAPPFDERQQRRTFTAPERRAPRPRGQRQPRCP